MNLMKKLLVMTLFMLATLAWAAAQQPGTTPGSSGQATSPSSQMPDASQSQPTVPGSAGQNPQAGMPAGSQGPAASAPVTEGCLGGHDPNYTITDKSGTTYKLNIPPSADTSKLAQHVGESVNVAGSVNNAGKAIDVQGIGKGSGKCPGAGSTGAQSPPKQ